ncbi:MAG TPA: histidine phosphotransferase, partial [Alphaproteobacteria bacterium]|nr:histidine phosphotransferase [Alphaproteobacteria bacterium]
MTTYLPTEIAELICTRISHDLIGNMGAISNAMELWEDDPSDVADLKPLLENSSQTLAA